MHSKVNGRVVSNYVQYELPERYQNPIGMLLDCHRRIEKFLDFCLSLCEMGTTTLDGESSEGLTKALDYFVGASLLHNADEEESLFPRLQIHKDQQSIQDTLIQITRLEQEHQHATSLHQKHDALGRLWLEKNIESTQLKEFCSLTQQLITFYSHHISCEDNEIFPVVNNVLSEKDLYEIGQEMWTRRGRKHCRARIDSQQQGKQNQ